MSQISIVGAGSWGTALAIVLASRFSRVRLWVRNPELAAAIRETHENASYLPALRIPANVEAHQDLGISLLGSSVVLLAVPAQHLRGVFRRMAPFLRESMFFVSAVKGIEVGSLKRMSELIAEETPFQARVAVLSGPTFAREVALGEPAAIVISCADSELAHFVQHAFSTPTFRLYTNDDPIGVEIGAALKNVIAIGAGICQGLKLGHNPVAALVTRGLAEITRLAVALGGKPQTLSGLAGLGDLVLTCTGELSRNRRVGIQLARGQTLDHVLASTNTVAEGVQTTFAAVALAERLSVELPITQQMDAILRLGKEPRQGIRDLMERSLKSE